MGQELLEVKNLSVSFRMYQSALKHTLVAGMYDVNLCLGTGRRSRILNVELRQPLWECRHSPCF